MNVEKLSELMDAFLGADIEHAINLATINAVSDVINKGLKPPYVIKSEHIMKGYEVVKGGKSRKGNV